MHLQFHNIIYLWILFPLFFPSECCGFIFPSHQLWAKSGLTKNHGTYSVMYSIVHAYSVRILFINYTVPCQRMETLCMGLSCVVLVKMGKILDTYVHKKTNNKK